MNTDPRQSALDAWDALWDPIPGLAEMLDPSRRQGLFIFGGCLTWLVLGLFVCLYLAVKYGAITIYVCAVVALRLLILGGCALRWGWMSEAGVIRRWRERRAVIGS